MASLSIAELPVYEAAASLVSAISPFPASAAKTTLRELDAAMRVVPDFEAFCQVTDWTFCDSAFTRSSSSGNLSDCSARANASLE